MSTVFRLVLLFMLFLVSQLGIATMTNHIEHQYDVNKTVLSKEIFGYDTTSNLGHCCEAPSSVNAQDRSFLAFSSDFLATKGVSPPNLSPLGAGRKGAFKEAKRQSGIPASQQPSRVCPAEFGQTRQSSAWKSL